MNYQVTNLLRAMQISLCDCPRYDGGLEIFDQIYYLTVSYLIFSVSGFLVFFSKTILQVSFQLSIFTQSLQRSWSLKQALWSAEWKTERIKTKLEFWWGGRCYTFSKIQHTWNKRLLSNRTVYCLVLFGAPLFLFLIRVHFIAILQPL